MTWKKVVEINSTLKITTVTNMMLRFISNIKWPTILHKLSASLDFATTPRYNGYHRDAARNKNDINKVP